MASTPLPNLVLRLMKLALVLTLVGAFSTVVFGMAVKQMNQEVRELKNFVEISKDVQPNFEQSLELYTQQTKEIIQFLSSLRPDGEEEYILFISTVEALAQDLSLDIDLESIEVEEENEGSVLSYQVSFNGSWSQLADFLEGLEDLPYFIRVKNVEYQAFNPALQVESNLPNIRLTLDLYVQ